MITFESLNTEDFFAPVLNHELWISFTEQEEYDAFREGMQADHRPSFVNETRVSSLVEMQITTGMVVQVRMKCIGPCAAIMEWVNDFIKAHSRDRYGNSIPPVAGLVKPKESIPEGLLWWLELGKYLKASEATIRRDGGYYVPAHLTAYIRSSGFVPYIWPEEANATTD